MTTVNDVHFISVDGFVQITDQGKGDEVTYQPSPSHAQINNQGMQNPYQNPTVPTYLYQNGQMIPVSHVHHGVSSPYLVIRNSAKAQDYMNIIWAICNIICCCFPFGIVALIMSVQTLNKRNDGDLQGARYSTKWATIMNVLALVSGIVIITLVILQFTEQNTF